MSRPNQNKNVLDPNERETRLEFNLHGLLKMQFPSQRAFGARGFGARELSPSTLRSLLQKNLIWNLVQTL